MNKESMSVDTTAENIFPEEFGSPLKGPPIDCVYFADEPPKKRYRRRFSSFERHVGVGSTYNAQGTNQSSQAENQAEVNPRMERINELYQILIDIGFTEEEARESALRQTNQEYSSESLGTTYTQQTQDRINRKAGKAKKHPTPESPSRVNRSEPTRDNILHFIAEHGGDDDAKRKAWGKFGYYNVWEAIGPSNMPPRLNQMNKKERDAYRAKQQEEKSFKENWNKYSGMYDNFDSLTPDEKAEYWQLRRELGRAADDDWKYGAPNGGPSNENTQSSSDDKNEQNEYVQDNEQNNQDTGGNGGGVLGWLWRNIGGG